MMRDWKRSYTESLDEPRMAARHGRRRLQRTKNARGGKPPPLPGRCKTKRPGRCKTETPGVRMLPGVFVSGHKQECLCCLLVDVVLLPVEGGVGLDDYVFVCGLL